VAAAAEALWHCKLCQQWLLQQQMAEMVVLLLLLGQ
jgi:hypothetical protein